MKVLISGGGTGGHIYPALAIAEELRRRDPSLELLYVGTKDGRENDLVPRAGLPFATIEIQGMPRKISPAMFPFGVYLLRGLAQAGRILRTFKPDFAIGTGGFVSGPVLYRAARGGHYTLIHEQNSYPGIANRILSRYVDDIAVTFEESIPYFSDHARKTLTGNPIRSVFFSLQREVSLYEKYGLDPKRKTVFVFGGSNGHDSINEAVAGMKEAFAATPYQMVLVTGPDHYDSMKDRFAEDGNIRLYPYLFDIHEMYAIADLMVTSSGAITLAEIQAAGLASILIPKAYTTENHQAKNAFAVRDKKAAEVLEEKDLDKESLFLAIESLLKDEKKLEEMKKASKNLGMPHAAKEIVDLAWAGWEQKMR